MVTAEEVADCQSIIKCTLGAKLPKSGFFKTSSPKAFLEIFRLREDGQRVAVHRTEVKKTDEPVWNPLKCSLFDLQ